MHTRTAHTAEEAVERAATQAAATAGVRIDGVTEPGEASELATLFATLWETSFVQAPISADLMCAMSSTGQYVVTARRDGALVGGTVAFLANTDGSPRLHSHITGVLPAAQGRSVGFALKLHQRAWALRHGLARIDWTFDPLVRRNAHFNLSKLGATARQYRVNAYGDMADAINAGGPSDRYVAEWPVVGPPRPGPAALPGDATVVLRPGPDGEPLVAAPEPGDSPRAAWIPEDIIALRRRAPELALRWRLALRAVLVAAMDEGFVATAMTRDGWYLVERRP